MALPAYAIIAGGSPSAMRAALMGVIYVCARLLGRAPLPMAAILLAASTLVITKPALVTNVGFQLTVLITAALVRWVPTAVEALPGFRWITAVLAVPVIAQISAAPIVAWHFRTAIPGAAAANLLVPWLLAPTLVMSLVATAVAPVWSAAAGPLLDAVSLFERTLWWAGTPGRSALLFLPTVPVATVTALAIAGWLALQVGRRAKAGVVAWIVIGILTPCWWWIRPTPRPSRVELLNVGDGLAALAVDGSGSVMVDGGRWSDEASQLLADLNVRDLAAVAVSHSDEDHLGGIELVVGAIDVGCIVLPTWMMSDPATVPVLRTARRVEASVIPVARGSCVPVGRSHMEILWPPTADLPSADNERSLVVRLRQPTGVILFTSDIGTASEFRISRLSSLSCQVLVAPHHGSRGSSSSILLGAAEPSVALIPAGPRNVHGHPHVEVLERIRKRGIPVRFPARDGRCGAVYRDGKWVPFP